ncbi:MAG: carotenoid oxygenase family protein [Microthrixaceae bacterium]
MTVLEPEHDLAAAFTGVTDDYLTGQYAPIHDERHDVELPVTGELPAGLRGAFVRNGPNPYFPPGGRYHVFDGDGMLHGVYLDGEGGVEYRNRWVDSRGLRHERSVGHSVYGGLAEFTMPPPDALEAGGLYKNTANTNIVRHAGRYLALMEGAHPTEVTAELDTVGEYDFGGALQGAMTAHPRWDPTTGEMLMFGYSPFPPYLRYHVVAADGTLVRSTDVPIDRSVMMHDFVVTPDHVVFFDLPAMFDAEALMTGGSAIRWQPDAGARIGIMPRDGEGSDTRWFDVDPFYVFHFLNAHEAADGTIVVDGCRSAAMPTAFGDDPRPDNEIRPYLWRWEIDADAGTVTDRQLDDRTGDFPRINDARTGLPNRFGAQAHTRHWDQAGVEFDGVIWFDLERDTSSTHVYGPTKVAGEAVFAADPSGTAEDDGWLVNIVTDLADGTSEFVVLDARDVEAGPVASVALPRRVPFGFHGNWMASAG